MMPRAGERTGGPAKWEIGGHWQQGGVKSQSEREEWLRRGPHCSGLPLLQLEAAAPGVHRRWLGGAEWGEMAWWGEEQISRRPEGSLLRELAALLHAVLVILEV